MATLPKGLYIVFFSAAGSLVVECVSGVLAICDARLSSWPLFGNVYNATSLYLFTPGKGRKVRNLFPLPGACMCSWSNALL